MCTHVSDLANCPEKDPLSSVRSGRCFRRRRRRIRQRWGEGFWWWRRRRWRSGRDGSRPPREGSEKQLVHEGNFEKKNMRMGRKKKGGKTVCLSAFLFRQASKTRSPGICLYNTVRNPTMYKFPKAG